MILLYLCRPGEKNEPLRHSLRSVAVHLPDAEVIIAGHKPRWVTGVGYIPYPQRRTERENQVRILRAVCANPSAPESFTLMNDDFFAMTPNPPVPLIHRETLADLALAWRGAWYAKALANTREILQGRGFDAPLSYDRVHCPMPVTTAVMRQALDGVGEGPVLHRSLYGNAVGGGTPGVDVKARSSEPLPDAPWVSTAPPSWMRQAGRSVRKTFPDPCRYEAD